MISRKNSNLITCINTHESSGVTDVDNINGVFNYHHNICTRSWSLWSDILSSHHALSTSLRLLNQHQEVSFTLTETFFYCFDRILWKLFVLHDEVVKVVSEIVSTCWTTVSVEDTKEADLWPIYFQIGFILWFQNIQDDAHSILVVVSDDSLVCVGSIWLYYSTFLLTCFRWLMILQLNGFWIESCWVITKEKSLYFHELDVWVFLFFT